MVVLLNFDALILIPLMAAVKQSQFLHFKMIFQPLNDARNNIFLLEVIMYFVKVVLPKNEVYLIPGGVCEFLAGFMGCNSIRGSMH